MSNGWFKKNDPALLLALCLPLLVRFYQDGLDAAGQRLILLAIVLGLAYWWTGIFARIGESLDEGQPERSPEGGQLHFAMLFVLFLPTPVSWGSAILAVSFGWVFGREVFGGRALLSPVLIALAFATLSFARGGFELQLILSAPPNPLLALACLPGAAWLLWKRAIAWPVLVAAPAGAALVAWLMPQLMAMPAALPWWGHFVVGTLTIGIVFLAASEQCAPVTQRARWLYGLMVGALVVLIRIANPDQPDGVVFAVLFGSLFAPLIDRALSWRASHD